jgi:hypothetical protein
MKEMARKFPCRDGGLGSVTLNAAGSTDRDQSATTLTYRWTEDAGSLTERNLGTQVMVPNLSMNFGAHRITLSVTDSQGASGTVTESIEVTDTKIDNYDIPPDVWAISQGAYTQLKLPAVHASDTCSGSVRITDDAPARSMFAEGFTPVTWWFDDWHGNVVAHQQNVFVLPKSMYPPPVAMGTAFLGGGVKGKTFLYYYGTKPKKTAIVADEYVLLRTPSGKLYSFDENGKLGKEGEVQRHGTRLPFGAAGTGGFVAVAQWDSKFPEKGAYTVQYVLTRERGSPQDNRTIVALHRFELVQ